MDYHTVEARHVGAHLVWLTFRDGTCGEIDLARRCAVLPSSPFGTPESLHDNRRVTG